MKESTHVPYLNLKDINKKYKEAFYEKLDDIFDNSSFVGGKYLEDFEKRFSEINGSKYSLGTSCGTDCLTLILRGLDLDKDKGYIYYPENTFIGTILGGLQLGYKFKPYPVNEFTKNADSQSLDYIKEDAIAVIVVYLYGHSINCINDFVSLCKNRNIPLIEDCSQSHFQEIENIKVGNFGDASFYSLFPGKNIGAIGDAGIICTNDNNLANSMSPLRTYGMRKKHEYSGKGFNHRMDAIQAAFLMEKLNDYDFIIKKRREIAKKYIDSFRFLNKMSVALPDGKDANNSVWHVFCLDLFNKENRNSLEMHLKEKNITTNVHYPVMIHEVGIWKEQITLEDFIPNNFGERILSLPCNEGMSNEEVEYVIQEVENWCLS